MFLIELTVPWEGKLVTSHQLKKAKYQDLIDEANQKGCHSGMFPIEVGCRAFPATSLATFCNSYTCRKTSKKFYKGKS